MTAEEAQEIFYNLCRDDTQDRLQVTEDRLFPLLNHLNLWILNPQRAEDGTLAQFAWDLFGFERGSRDLTYDSMQKRARQLTCGLRVILFAFCDCNMAEQSSEEYPDLMSPEKTIRKMHDMIHTCHEFLYNEWHARGILDPTFDTTVPSTVSQLRFSYPELDTQKLTPTQKLTIFLLEKLRRLGYRKNGSYCYEQVHVDYNGARHNTRAWKKVCTIEQFTYDNINMVLNFDQWLNLTASPNAVKHVCTYLENSKDPEFPFLRPSRYLSSWANGLYHSLTDTFLPYGEPVSSLGEPNLAGLQGARREQERIAWDTYIDEMQNADAYKFTNQVLDLRWFGAPEEDDENEEELVDSGPVDPRTDKSWLNIPTPAFDQIIHHQELGFVEGASDEENAKNMLDVYMWMLAMMGRLLYPLNKKDSWQVLLFVKGLAGTGKSTIAKCVSQFFLPEQVAQLSSNIENTFGLGPIHRAFLWICYEVSNKFRLEQSDLQSMVSGEPMSIPIKNKDAVSIEWDVPGIMMGNVLPPWLNAQGSIGRRIIMIEFEKSISNGDPTLPQRLAQQIGALLVKANKAYHWATANYGHKIIWDHLPSYFISERTKMETEMDSLYYFVTMSDELERMETQPVPDQLEEPSPADGGFSMWFENFQQMYYQWCEKTKRTSIKLTDHNHLVYTLTKAKLQYRKASSIPGDKNKPKGDYIIGVRPKNYVQQANTGSMYAPIFQS